MSVERWWVYDVEHLRLWSLPYTDFRAAQQAVESAFIDEFWVLYGDDILPDYTLFELGGYGNHICYINRDGTVRD